MNQVVIVGPDKMLDGKSASAYGRAIRISDCITLHSPCPHPSWDKAAGTSQEKYEAWVRQHAERIVLRVGENVPNGTYPVIRQSTRPEGSSRRGRHLKTTGSRQERYCRPQRK